jgi:hypothetical protein
MHRASAGKCVFLGPERSKRITHNNNISTAILRRAKRATLGEPIAVGVFGNPVNDSLLLLGRYALVRVTDTLKNVVDVLRDAEDTGAWLRHYSSTSEQMVDNEVEEWE